MKKLCIIAVVVVVTGGLTYVAVANYSAKHEGINQNNKRKVRCVLCNGTGRAGSGVKGEGNYSCTRCKGTGWK